MAVFRGNHPLRRDDGIGLQPAPRRRARQPRHARRRPQPAAARPPSLWRRVRVPTALGEPPCPCGYEWPAEVSAGAERFEYAAGCDFDVVDEMPSQEEFDARYWNRARLIRGTRDWPARRLWSKRALLDRARRETQRGILEDRRRMGLLLQHRQRDVARDARASMGRLSLWRRVPAATGHRPGLPV